MGIPADRVAVLRPIPKLSSFVSVQGQVT